MMPDEYLKKLEKKLKRHIPKKEMQDILSDYREFFQNGMSDGKSEQELICEFGTPEVLAETIITDHYADSITGKRLNLDVKVLVKKSILLAILCIIGYFIYATSKYSHRSTFIDSLDLQYPQAFIIVLLLVLIFPIVGFILFDYDKYFKTDKKVNRYKTKLLLGSIPFLYHFIHYIPYLYGLIKNGDSFQSVEFSVNFVAGALYTAMGLFISTILLLCIYSAQHKSTLIVTIYPLLGALSSAFFIEGILADMATVEELIWNLLKAPIPFVASFIFIFIALPILSKRYGTVLNLQKDNNSNKGDV